VIENWIWKSPISYCENFEAWLLRFDGNVGAGVGAAPEILEIVDLSLLKIMTVF